MSTPALGNQSWSVSLSRKFKQIDGLRQHNTHGNLLGWRPRLPSSIPWSMSSLPLSLPAFFFFFFLIIFFFYQTLFQARLESRVLWQIENFFKCDIILVSQFSKYGDHRLLEVQRDLQTIK